MTQANATQFVVDSYFSSLTHLTGIFGAVALILLVVAKAIEMKAASVASFLLIALPLELLSLTMLALCLLGFCGLGAYSITSCLKTSEDAPLLAEMLEPQVDPSTEGVNVDAKSLSSKV